MHFEDKAALTGELEILLYDATGKLIRQEKVKNIITSVGKNWMMQRALDASMPAMGWMAIGTSSTAEVAGDTQLGAEVGRVSLTSSTRSGNANTYSATFGAGVGNSGNTNVLITEAGIFNASTAGTILNHVTFGVITKDPGMTLTLNWTVTQN